MPFPLYVLLSPASAPSVLAQVITAGKAEIFERSAMVVLQRHAIGESLDALAECLEELSGRAILRVAAGAISLKPGSLCLIGENSGYRFDGEALVARPGGFNLDEFLASLAGFGNRATIALLPGRDTPVEQLGVWSSLVEKGVSLAAAVENPDPDNWATQLEAGGLKVNRLPLAALLGADAQSGGTLAAGRLIIADDDPRVREILADLCRLRGFTFDLATDGLDVLKFLRKGGYAGLILDINMPELDGIDTLERLRVDKPDFPVLVASGETDRKHIDRVKALGAEFLPKPFTTDQFQKAFGSLIKKIA